MNYFKHVKTYTRKRAKNSQKRGKNTYLYRKEIKSSQKYIHTRRDKGC